VISQKTLVNQEATEDTSDETYGAGNDYFPLIMSTKSVFFSILQQTPSTEKNVPVLETLWNIDEIKLHESDMALLGKFRSKRFVNIKSPRLIYDK
jgi:hypothetical protein